VTAVASDDGSLVYYAASMPSGVQCDKDCVVRSGQRYDTFDSFMTSLSDQGIWTDTVVKNDGILPLSSCEPSYNWGYRETSRGNCYRYAVSDPLLCGWTATNDPFNQHSMNPGGLNLATIPDPADGCPKMLEAAEKDGLYIMDRSTECPAKDTQVALVIANSNGKNEDFHWYRRCADGTWKHKLAANPLVDYDASKQKIIDPELCDRDYFAFCIECKNYNQFCDYMCVPNGMIDLDKNGNSCPGAPVPKPTPVKPVPKPVKPVPKPVKPVPKPVKPAPKPIKPAPKPVPGPVVVFRDDFLGTSLDYTRWSVDIDSEGRSQFGNSPIISGGIARFRFDTYGFIGTEIYTNNLFSRGTFGLEIEARIRLVNPLPSGLVASFFTYFEKSSGAADGIEINFLSKQINLDAGTGTAPIDLETYDNFVGNEVLPYFSSQTVDIAGLSVGSWHTYIIRWLPGRTEWLVDGAVVASSNKAQPNADSYVCLSFWAADSDWSKAYDGNLKPASSSGSNQQFFYHVDYVEVRQRSS